MATTTNAVNACDASVWLDDGTGTPRDISGSSTSITMDFDLDLGEYQVFQQRWPQRLECGRDATFELAVVYSTPTNEAYDILKQWVFANPPGPRTLSVYIPDKDVGSDMYYGEFLLESVSVPADPSDPGPIAVTATLRPNGEIHHTTAAT